MATVKCKKNHLAYVAGKEYNYAPHSSGIFSMLQVFAGTGDDDDDELFYPNEMEQFFHWDETMMPKKEAPKEKPKNTYVPPPPPPPPVKKEETPEQKRYNRVMEVIRSREENIRLYPTDKDIEIWKTELASYKLTAEKLKKKL